MRNRMQFLLLMAAMMFTGCSQNEEMEGPDSPNGDATTNYLTVNIVAAPNMGTRADSNAPGNDEFEKGTENTVESVRFYFFDANGNVATVKDGKPYYDWDSNITNAGDGMPNVAKKLAATLIIQSPDGDELPASVVAVINPTDEIKRATVRSLTALNRIIQDFSTATTNFVMSNSVYATEGNPGSKVEAVNVEGHIFPTPEAAKSSPVNIYVERVLAKVRLGVTIPNGTQSADGMLYPTGTTPQQFDGNDIYVKFLGWNVTATADKSRLMKEINPGWGENLFGATEPWNYFPYFRSFWAVNPSPMSYSYGTFSKDGDDKKANALTSFDSKAGQNYTYVQENASDNEATGANPNTPTKVIIAAQLVNEQGGAITFAEWAGQRVAIDNLKALLLSRVSLWKGKSNGGYEQITEADVEIKTASAIGLAGETTPGRYKVYLQLTDEASKLTWYSDDKGTSETDANKTLINLGPTKIWKDGYTYYYFDIRHLNKTVNATYGSLGVVRNHLYDATITSLTGLGTPVYDPEEPIHPEKPEDDESYIVAQIEILSWRLVPNDVTLEW